MASGLVLINGSPLIGSPIIYQVVAANVANACSFHRVNLTVTASISSGGGSTSLTMSSPADSGETLLFDISSALRAVADNYQYSPVPPSSYPFITYRLTACDEYMKNGEVYENVGMVSAQGGKVLLGAYSDLERFLSPDGKLAQHFTRKPNTLPEVVMVGETFVAPLSFAEAKSEANITDGPTSKVIEINTEGLQTINGRSVYAVPAGQPDRYQFRFVNGLGCLESVSFSSLRSVEMNCTVETYIRAVQETFGSFSRGLVSKKNDYESWKLSTPPLDEAWLSWFLHEFIMSKFVWINIGGHWISCHVVPDETIQGANRIDKSLLSVSFSVRLDINGSPLTALAI